MRISLKQTVQWTALAALLIAASVVGPFSAVLAQSNDAGVSAQSESGPLRGGPIRLRQGPVDSGVNQGTSQATSQGQGLGPAPGQTAGSSVALPTLPAIQVPERLSEFEAFVGLPRFGANLIAALSGSSPDYSPVVPPEYVIQTGDELQLTLWGSVDADLRLTVDRTGRVSVPRVGPIMVAGIRFAELQETISRRVAQVFKNFELSVSVGRLRGVRVYVTGAVHKPGAYAVAGLSTVMNAVMQAGGPAQGGSFRNIELRRDGRLVGTLDLYDLLLRGDRRADRLVQPDDVIHVSPVGNQVALRGSVNQRAVFELKPGDSLRDLLKMAGGPSPVADLTRATLERLGDRQQQRIVQVELPRDETTVLQNGDVVNILSLIEVTLSQKRQNKRVRVEGEVTRPGDYVLPPESTLLDAVRAAGGMTESAFLPGAHFLRESVRLTQQENYGRAVRDLEIELARTDGTTRVSNADEAAVLAARNSATTRLVERMRQIRPTGRIVLNMSPGGAELPPLAVEDGDQLFIPARPTTVGVFGSVFNGGSYLFSDGRSVGDYLRLAGGMTKGADADSVFVVRANGSVTSARQRDSSWFGSRSDINSLASEPGDTVFVPEELNKTTFVQSAKDWTQILYQLGIGLAAFQVIKGF